MMSQLTQKGLSQRGRALQHVGFCDSTGRQRGKQSEHSATPPRGDCPRFLVSMSSKLHPITRELSPVSCQVWYPTKRLDRPFGIRSLPPVSIAGTEESCLGRHKKAVTVLVNCPTAVVNSALPCITSPKVKNRPHAQTESVRVKEHRQYWLRSQ